MEITKTYRSKSNSPWRVGGEDSTCNKLFNHDGGHQGAGGRTATKAQGPAKTFTIEEMVPVLDKCKYMSSLSIKND
jgi:hypothetical protein